jgi:hypothetical protein
MHVNVIIDKLTWKIRGAKKQERDRRMDKVVYVMWSFMCCCRFTRNLITLIK